MSAISKTEEYMNMRVKMGLPARWRSEGTEVIPFQASWLVSRRIDRPYPKPDLGQPMDELDHRFGYRFDPIALVEWATEWLRAGESVMGIYPWRKHSAVRNGQFHIKRQGRTVLGYCEVGLIHYVFRPHMIHSYTIPQFYQRPMAPMNMDDFNQLYARQMYNVDLYARQTIVRVKTVGDEAPSWRELANDIRLRANDVGRWKDAVPADRHVAASVALERLEDILRVGRPPQFGRIAFNVLQQINISPERFGKITDTLSYDRSKSIFDEIATLKMFLESDDSLQTLTNSEEMEKIIRATYEKIETLLKTLPN